MTFIQRFPLPMLLAIALGTGCNNTAETPSPAPEKIEKETKPATPKKPRPSRLSEKPVLKAPVVDDFKDQKAPEKFAVKLDTTKGDIIIDVTREWSPHGVDRFYTAVKEGFYDDNGFFRVLPGFMVQVGLSGDPEVNQVWRGRKIKDDPLKKSNTRGMVSFAKPGMPDSRTTQFFINYGNNARLDPMGFSPIGKVRDMKPVDAIFSGYKETPSQGRIQKEGNAYLKSAFPQMDYIVNATIIEQ